MEEKRQEHTPEPWLLVKVEGYPRAWQLTGPGGQNIILGVAGGACGPIAMREADAALISRAGRMLGLLKEVLPAFRSYVNDYNIYQEHYDLIEKVEALIEKVEALIAEVER